MTQRTRSEIETSRRIRLAVYAYAYEVKNVSLVTDHHFDQLALQIDRSVSTNRPDLDAWWRMFFSPDTGQWVHNYPDKNRIAQIYERYYANENHHTT